MDLTNVFTTIIEFMYRVFNLLYSHAKFTAFGYSVSMFDIIIVFILIGMVVSLFWKGAKA